MKPSDLQILQKKLAKLQRELNGDDNSEEGRDTKRQNGQKSSGGGANHLIESKQRLRISDFDISTTLGNLNFQC